MAANPKNKQANAENADASASQEDQSMEDILQSIRKIIADENDEPVKIEEDSLHDSDILELTDAIQEDGSVVNVTDQESDVIRDIDDALGIKTPSEPPVENAISAAKAPVEPAADEAIKPVTSPAVSKPHEETAEPKKAPAAPEPIIKRSEEGLVAPENIAAAAEAMRVLRQPQSPAHPAVSDGFGGLSFSSGDTVEGLVAQMLRPLLKEWLDTNLAAIVQKEVEREVRRIAASLKE